ncbi:MAG: lasso peptide biosynthesis B2 protein [Actinomycetota bacterium]
MSGDAARSWGRRLRWAHLVPWASFLVLYYETLGKRKELRRPAAQTPVAAPKGSRPPWRTVVGVVRMAARLTPGNDTCLVRSFAAARMLRHYGYPAHVVIGVPETRIGAPGWEAHAWVEVAGAAVGRGDHQEIVRLRP